MTEYDSFNPRTHTGCDSCWSARAAIATGFNPRTHTGCDAVTKVEKPPARWFQSTHPHGVRHAADALSQLGTLVSIHAPTRGATADTLLGVADCKVSIHAPTRGATSRTSKSKLPLPCFNPRTHTGCDSELTPKALTHTGFNPRTHTGCDVILIL